MGVLSVQSTVVDNPEMLGRILKTLVGYRVEATVDVASLADAAGATTSSIAVPGAKVGDLVLASFAVDLVGITVTGYVDAVDSVKLRVQNESGSTVDLASTTVRVCVLPWNLL